MKTIKMHSKQLQVDSKSEFLIDFPFFLLFYFFIVSSLYVHTILNGSIESILIGVLI